MLKFARTALVAIAAVALLAASGDPAEAGKRPRRPVLRTYRVHTHYTEPTPSLDGVECRGAAGVPPSPNCVFHFTGTATFTGTMYGDVRYHNWGMWGTDGRLTYEGPDYVDGGVEGCGTGTFIIDTYNGYLDTASYDPQKGYVNGYNEWRFRKGSGTGQLKNLVDGGGVNHWREYFDAKTGRMGPGEGDFTGWISCYR